MNREIVRLNQLEIAQKEYAGLKSASLALLAGEVNAFVGLENSGKRVLVDFLVSGKGYLKDEIFVNGQEIRQLADLRSQIYFIEDRNYNISNWSVAEYMMLRQHKTKHGIYDKKSLEKEVQLILKQAELQIEPDKLLGECSEYQKRAIDVLKASRAPINLVIIKDEFIGVATRQVQTFKKLLSRYLASKAIILLCNSDIINQQLADRYIVFDNNKIVKKCDNHSNLGQGYLSRFMSGQGQTDQSRIYSGFGTAQDIVVEMEYNNKNYQINMKATGVTVVITNNLNLKRALIQALKDIRYSDRDDGYDIAVIFDLGGDEEVLTNMSIGDNLLIPSLVKVSTFDYIKHKNKITQTAEQEMDRSQYLSQDWGADYSTNQKIQLVFERWLIYKPDILVVFEPFSRCDAKGVEMVNHYIEKLAANGISILIVKSRLEHINPENCRIIEW